MVEQPSRSGSVVPASWRWAGLLAACWLAGCATQGPAPSQGSREDAETPSASAPPSAPGADYKVGQPYEVAGKTYVPEVDYQYDETGIASWYGRKFHGSATANGEIYDMSALTAAHKTLPLPSIVKVTNLENGRRVRLRVNDRGPFKKGRIIDLSRRAADLLGMRKTGTARVRVQIDAEASRELRRALEEGRSPDLRTASLSQPAAESADGQANGDAETSATAGTSAQSAPTSAQTEATSAQQAAAVEQVAPRDTTLFIQVGSFLERRNAQSLAQELASLGQVQVSQARLDGRRFHRVRLGPLNTVEAADTRLAQVKAAGYDQARLVVDW